MDEQIKKTSSAGGIVVNSNDEILVVNQKGISWPLPKGHIEPGEEIIDAAKKEIYEESGVSQLDFIKELGSYDRYKISSNGGEDRSELKTIALYLFKTPENTASPIDSHNPEAKWVPREEVAGLLTHPKDRKFFLSLIKEI